MERINQVVAPIPVKQSNMVSSNNQSQHILNSKSQGQNNMLNSRSQGLKRTHIVMQDQPISFLFFFCFWSQPKPRSGKAVCYLPFADQATFRPELCHCDLGHDIAPRICDLNKVEEVISAPARRDLPGPIPTFPLPIFLQTSDLHKLQLVGRERPLKAIRNGYLVIGVPPILDTGGASQHTSSDFANPDVAEG